jgi:hypothetical protein
MAWLGLSDCQTVCECCAFAKHTHSGMHCNPIVETVALKTSKTSKERLQRPLKKIS